LQVGQGDHRSEGALPDFHLLALHFVVRDGCAGGNRHSGLAKRCLGRQKKIFARGEVGRGTLRESMGRERDKETRGQRCAP
jgi:hypothetical protein